MNVLTTVLMLFAVIGFIDKAIGGRMGLEREIDAGLLTMGTMSVYMAGIYCIGKAAIENNAETIARFTAVLPMDPSVLIGSILAPDLGGQAIALAISSDEMMGYFSGVIVGGCLGQFISFQLPVVFSMLDPVTKQQMTRGFVYGVVAIPFGLVAGGLVMGIAPLTLLLNISFIMVACVILLVGFLKHPAVTEKVLMGIGSVTKSLCQVLFVFVVLGIFLPRFSVVSQEVLLDVLYLVLRMTLIVCGGLVFSRLVVRFLGNLLERIGAVLRTDKLSVVGLLLNMINSLTVVTMIQNMDDNGKTMNAAFSVSGAYILGGQMALVLLVAPPNVIAGFIAAKVTAGAVSIGITMYSRRSSLKNQGA